MPRFWFLPLLFVLLWPTPAMAGMRTHEQDRIDLIDFPRERGAVRSASGLQLLRALDRDHPDPATHHSPNRQLVAGSDGALLHLVRRIPSEILPAVGVFSPHCERLPYYATAPPRLR